jgi:nucleotide-binding universal stress UspA family protein
MIRIKNVLVATDFSEPSAVALEYGRELARTYSAKLHVLHVAEDLRWRYATDMTPPVLVDVQDDLEASLRSRLEALMTDEDRSQLGCAPSSRPPSRRPKQSSPMRKPKALT